MLPTHTETTHAQERVVTIALHHERVDFAIPSGDVRPCSDDVVVYMDDTTSGQTKRFDAQLQVLGKPHRDQGRLFANGPRERQSRCRPHFPQGQQDGPVQVSAQQPFGLDTFKICKSIVVYLEDTTLGHTEGSLLSFRCLEGPSGIKAGCSPGGIISGSRVACRISLKANERAQCS